jgi:predicted nucleic acid-binding protein
MELRYGLDLLPEGRRKTDLSDALERMLISAFRDRIAVFDDRAAEATARLMADSRRSGRPLAVEDGMIAGVALAREAVLATRNLKDFEGLGLTLVNPFQTA